MATGGSLIAGSDEIIEYLCSPCKKKGNRNESTKFCVDCQEYFCGKCVDSHNSFSALAEHKFVENSQSGTLNKIDIKEKQQEPTERCKYHPLKIVDMYCTDHDSVGCLVCFTINHK